MCEIFKRDISKVFQLLGALDGVSENYFPFAVEELENYYKRENIVFDDEMVIDKLDNIKTKEDLDPMIFSKETINMFDIYNEANSLEKDLYNHYMDMKKEQDIDLEIEK